METLDYNIFDYDNPANYTRLPRRAKLMGIAYSVTLPQEVMETLYRIPPENIGRLQEKIAEMNVKAAKLGCPPITVTVKTIELGTYEDENTKKTFQTTHVHVEVAGGAPKFEGWTFIGTLDHLAGDTPIVRSVPGYEVPEQYRAVANKCDHCGKIRNRNETFVCVHENGDTVQVGRNCVRDFLGHVDPKNVVRALTWLHDLHTSMNDEGEGGFRGYSDPRTDVHYLVTIACAIVRVKGYTSKKAAEAYAAKSGENGRRIPTTRSLTFYWRNRPTACGRYAGEIIREWEQFRRDVQLTDADTTRATTILDWVKTLDNSSDFNHNVKALCASVEGVRGKDEGYVVGAVGAYLFNESKNAQKREQAAAITSVHIGTIGQRIEMSVTIVRKHLINTQFGVMTIVSMKDSIGNVIVWKASVHVGDEVGTTFTIKGSVKEHSEFNGVKQTVLTRCKIS